MWYSSPDDAGYTPNDTIRYENLKWFSFNSVLDVGSGPCRLKQWLDQNGIFCEYEAVDIREDTLRLCQCKTYTTIPTHRKYDMVCLFGTVGLIGNNTIENQKSIMRSLLHQSAAVAEKYIVFSTIKKCTGSAHHVLYTREETEDLAKEICTHYTILENAEPTERYVRCIVNKK